MSNKRGLSTIIITMILILISLVAIGVFWVVVNNLIKGGTEDINLGRLTFSAEINRVLVDNSSNNMSILVKRNSGEGNVTKMKFIFYSENDNEIITQDINLEQFAQKNFVFHLETNVTNITRISIAPVLGSGKGEENVGNVLDTYEI
ncbi:MAG: hypothetical protein PHQ66_02855 [Candidatus Nanoarchaeia archaeon]|nr:hypothetical protein [Candidatus Nanoarchaeia archaeon]MDD5357695.1 hypothetical protein [Candidatus Nanoarchaeia archaeon]MDD5588614.1 hypothetical protein [Candidatus Nanoarchaeia archaeon]